MTENAVTDLAAAKLSVRRRIPPHLVSVLLRGILYVRGATIVPMQFAWRRLQIALSSGTKRTERLADFVSWRGDAMAAAKLWRDLEQEQPTRAVWPINIARVARERGDLDTAERVLLDACERGIEDERVELDLLRGARLSRRSNAAVTDAETIVADPEAAPTKIYHAAYHLMTQNLLESARTGFGRVLVDDKHGAIARSQLAAIDLLADMRSRGRPDIPGRVSPAQNSVIVRERSSETLVIGFTLPEGTLGLPLNAAHMMFSSAGVNALYLYDSRQVFHLSGTDRFGPGYRAMIEGVRALAAEMGVRRLVTVGGSGSGYTAIRAGIDLEADGAVVFSPATIMDPTSDPGLARRGNAHTLHRLRERALPMMAELRPLVRDRKSCPSIEIYYGASNLRDIMHASHLAGLRGVTLHEVPGLARHDCLTEMARLGYRDLLKAIPATLL